MKDISIEDYTYELPDEKIAHHPLPERDSSKLLVFQQGQIREDIYRNLDRHLPSGSLMVFNNSRVIEARLIFTKSSGGKIEIFCLEPAADNSAIEDALVAHHSVSWICLVGGASKWKTGQVLQKSFVHKGESGHLTATYIAQTTEAFVIKFEWTAADLSFAEVLHLTGDTPLPPYIKRQAEINDLTRYQTIYADPAGSVAAPTAGLHFTEAVLGALKAKQIQQTFVTLHVGAGTFKPVKARVMRDHEMHAEFIDVGAQTITLLSEHCDNHITAVGTTSMRTMESLFWMGVKVVNDPAIDPATLALEQWYAMENNAAHIPVKVALEGLLAWMHKQGMDRLISKTRLLIAPGYKFRIADALVTNLHQPRSTLLLLVAAMAGDSWRSIYDYALNHNFRFLSYGDGCLIYRDK